MLIFILLVATDAAMISCLEFGYITLGEKASLGESMRSAHVERRCVLF